MLIPFAEITKKYNMKIHGILHIGAHNCEELEAYQNYGLKNSQIIWVEANPKLVEQNLNIDKSRIIKNFICCDIDKGKTKLNIANNGQSSSILELGTHEKSYPSIKYNGCVEVKNCRIDTMYDKDNIPKTFANFLNIDIQGAELLALKGMSDLIDCFDYIYLEVNSDYVYKNCALVHEIDEYLLKYNFKRIETKWTNDKWGDALYIKVENNFDLLENVRCSKEIWQIKGITFEEALKKADRDPSVEALHWCKNNGGDGRISGIKGWYQGAGGDIGIISNNDWDTIVIPQKKNF
jgi:FkbM family methyltransferase